MAAAKNDEQRGEEAGGVPVYADAYERREREGPAKKEGRQKGVKNRRRGRGGNDEKWGERGEAERVKRGGGRYSDK